MSLLAGLSSPGPVHKLPDRCFAKASVKTPRPTWGPPPRHESQKIARSRTEEVRFRGHMFMHEMKGHFSPGPQYAIPGGMGGAPANRFGAEKKLKDDRWRFAGIEPTATRSMTAAQLGGHSGHWTLDARVSAGRSGIGRAAAGASLLCAKSNALEAAATINDQR